MMPVGTSPCRVMPAASYLNGLASSPITVLPVNLSPISLPSSAPLGSSQERKDPSSSTFG